VLGRAAVNASLVNGGRVSPFLLDFRRVKRWPRFHAAGTHLLSSSSSFILKLHGKTGRFANYGDLLIRRLHLAVSRVNDPLNRHASSLAIIIFGVA